MLRILTVVDLYSRFSPVVGPRLSYRGGGLVAALERVCTQTGYRRIYWQTLSGKGPNFHQGSRHGIEFEGHRKDRVRFLRCRMSPNSSLVPVRRLNDRS